jgi:hypothetical protein
VLSAVAVVVAFACVAASAFRLKSALAPTKMDPEVSASVLARAPGREAPLAVLARAAAQEPGASWEKDLFEALGAPSPQREARINEQLTELDHLVQRWVRVPRVCASICTSSGFLLAAAVLRASLAAPADSMDAAAVDAAVIQAIDVAAIGLAGAAFCIAIQMRARKAATATNAAYDRLVERLERASQGHTGVGALGQLPSPEGGVVVSSEAR